MRARTRTALIAATGLATVLTALPAAQAITGGSPDGGGHPNVAMLLFYAKDAPTDQVAVRYRCTGSLVSPTVILTAGHCTDGQVGQTLVYFDATIAEEAPSDLPRAEGDVLDEVTQTWSGSAAGFVGDETDTRRSYVHGTAYTHPEYSNFTDMRNWNDVGVVVLSEPVTGVAPMQVAPLGFLDDHAQPALNSTLFTFVGYGTEVRKPDSGPQKPEPMSYPLIRRVTAAPGQKLTEQILQVNGNPNDVKGDGGTCFGDSGGPGILEGYQVTVTSYGYTDNCRYIDGHQRVDIPSVQSWLATFGVVDAPSDTPADISNGNGNGKGNGKANGQANANAGANGNAAQAPGHTAGAATGPGTGQAVGHDNAVGKDAGHAVRAGAAQ